jgi:hypothetical protein
MTQITHLVTEVSALFCKPLKQIYSVTKAQYLCRMISDLDFAALGILRCLSHAKSGHEFLQHHIDHGCKGVTVAHFFKAIQNKRRLTNLTSLNAQLVSVMERKVEDPFAEHKIFHQFKSKMEERQPCSTSFQAEVAVLLPCCSSSDLVWKEGIPN